MILGNVRHLKPKRASIQSSRLSIESQPQVLGTLSSKTLDLVGPMAGLAARGVEYLRLSEDGHS